MPQRLCRKTGDTSVVRGDSGLSRVHPKNLALNMVCDGATSLPACQRTQGHDPINVCLVGITTLSNGTVTELLLCARPHFSALHG